MTAITDEHSNPWGKYYPAPQVAQSLISPTQLVTDLPAVHVNRLPPEILSHIFTFLLPDISSSRPFPLYDDVYKWFRVVSDVCHYWKHVALDSPALWDRAHISNWTCSLALESLRRFANIPLAVYVSDTLRNDFPNRPRPNIEAAIFELSKRIHCLREFHLEASWQGYSPLWELLDRPAPLLETLTIDVTYTSESTITLDRLFHDETPRLKHVYLSGPAYWPSNHFRNLSHLHVFNQGHSRSFLTEFLDALEASSNTLEELVLVRALPSYMLEKDDIEPGRSFLTVSLPALRYLEVGDSGATWDERIDLQMFVAHVVIPTTTKSCFYESYQMLNIPDYFPRRSNDCQPLPQIKKLVLTSFNLALAYGAMVGHVGSTLYVNFRSRAPDVLLQSPNVEFLKDVEELVFIPSASWSADFDWSIFGVLPSLRTLKVCNLHRPLAHEFWLALRTFDSDRQFQWAQQLKSVYISGTPPENIRRRQPGDMESAEVDVADRMYIESLRKTIVFRSHYGNPLEKVVVQGFPECMYRILGDRLPGGNIVVCDGSNERERDFEFGRDEILGAFWESYHLYVQDRH